MDSFLSGRSSRSSHAIFGANSADRPRIWAYLIMIRSNPGTIGFRQKVACALLVSGTQEMFCLQRRECGAWKTVHAVRGTRGMSCVEHTECLACNTQNVLRATHGMSRVEHKARPA